MHDIAPALAELLRAGETVALATIVRTAGPTPRLAGARMVIRREGGHLGSVGGGCGEAAVVQAALAALDAGRPRFVEADLTEDVTDESEAACGGRMECLIRPWGLELAPVVEAVLSETRSRRAVWLVTCLAAGPMAGAMVVVCHAAEGAGPAVEPLAWAGMSEGQALLAARTLSDGALPAASPGESRSARSGPEEATLPLLVEKIEPPPVLLVCGGGHIALPLARMGSALDFDVVVIDDRPSYANTARFPWAAQVLCAGFREALAAYPVDRTTYVVIVTRGHRQDMVCLRSLLGRGAGYLGMIGSRRRVAAILETLRAETEPGALEELHSPVGLDIGAQTPAEIAISILAEVILTRRGGSGKPLTLVRSRS